MASFGDWLEGSGSGSDGDENSAAIVGGGSGGGGGGGGDVVAAAITPIASASAKAASGAEGDSARAALFGYLRVVQETVQDPDIRVSRWVHAAARAHRSTAHPSLPPTHCVLDHSNRPP